MVLLSTALGLITGSMLGILGGGGSIIAVPIMVYALGLEAKAAIGTSLIIVGAASLLGAIGYYRSHDVLVRTALLFGSAGAIGSYPGALLGKLMPDDMQLSLFACVMALIGVLMLAHPSKETKHSTARALKLSEALIAGCGAGFLTGLLGVGGGFIIVPALTLIAGLPIRKAIGTSLVVISMNSMIGAAAYGGSIRLENGVVPFVLGTIAATPVAGHFARYMHQDQLKTAFAITLLVLSAIMLAKQTFGF